MTKRTTLLLRLLAMPLVLLAGVLTMSSSSHAATGYSQYLRRYPYLTDVVDSYATINWATDRTNSTGAVRYGLVGSEACTAHTVTATRTAVSVNTVAEYQWSAMLNLTPGAQYCYRVYLGSGAATEVDLLGTDASPVFWTQVPSGSKQSYTFDVFGDWGAVDSTGANPYQAKLMSLIASSGARFALTAGDNGYPSGSQANYGDLVQTGADLSAIFGPGFWKVPGSFTPIFAASGNHGLSNSDPNHPLILNFPQTKAVALSGGRYVKETYCCLDGTTSANYPSAWYAFDAGLARFYVLDASWADLNIGTASSAYQVDYDYHWTPSSREYQWLQADLASHPSLIKLAVVHYPLYSDDPHQGSDTYLQGSSSLEGLLKQYGVQVAFDGHSHTYQRFAASTAGIPNYVTGGGGAVVPLGAVGPCTALDLYAIGYTSKGYSCNTRAPTSPDPVYHFLKVTVSGTSVTVTPINSLGTSFDAMSYPVTSGDITAPSTPAGLSASAATSGTDIDLAWPASTDNQAVRGYDIYRNGTLITQTDAATLSYADTRLRPATGYTYTVDAFDGSGNQSAQSAAASATTPSNATYIFNPVADSYVAGDNTAVNYGTSVVLKADGSPDYHSYLRFNVGEVAGTVTKATLSLYTTFSSATGYQVSTVTSNQWDEGSVTYANAPALGPAVASSGKFSSGNWVNVDVTSLITGNGIYDLGVSTTSTSSMSFNSRDAADSWPQLIIQTSATPATPTATASATPTITPTFATGALTFTPSDDATLNQGSSTTNYGTATTLALGAKPSQDLMLKFTVSGTGGLPIKSAALRLYAVVNTNSGGAVHLVTSNTWTEGTVNWSNAPAFNSATVASFGSAGPNSWIQVDVSSLVKGDGTYSLRVVNASQKGASYSSKEGSFAPQLVLSYTILPTATLTPTITPTFTDTPTATATSTLTPTATPTVTPTVNPAPAFSDGFESGNMSSWTSGAGLTVESSLANGGSFAAQGNTINGNTYAKKTFGTSYAEGYARLYFNLVSTSSQVNLLRYRSATDTSVAYLFVNTSGQLGLHNDTTGTNTLSATTVSSGWHALVFHAIMNGAASTIEVWIDGAPVTDFSFMTDLGTNLIGGVQIGDSQTGRTYNAVFDDVVFDTQWIGLSGIVTPTPTPPATATFTPTSTATPSNTPTDTATPTSTMTPTNTATPTDTATATNTPAASDTPTSTNTPTDTATSTDTPTPGSVPTDTPTSTPTLPLAPTDTPTATPTLAPVPTDTPTATPTLAPVPTDTPTATSTPTLGVPPATNTPTSTPTPTNTSMPGATPIFSDGFETGTLSAWTTKGGLLVESTNVHSGLFAAEGTTTNGATYAKKTLPSTYADGYARIYFKIVSQASQINLLRYRTSAGTSIGYLFVSSTGKLGLFDDATGITTTSATAVGPGWHSLEFHASIGGSYTEVWLDGVLINSLSSATTLGATAIGAFQIGEVNTGRTYDVIFDDVVFDAQFINP